MIFMSRYSRIFHFLFFFTLLICSSSVKAQLSNNARISLLTCDPGDDLYSIFGHSAIRITDPVNRIDEVYNYGTFDYRDPDFYPKFLKGKLRYWLNIEGSLNFIRTYDSLRRSVKEELILLDSVQRNTLYLALRENSLPENRLYLYDFLFDNCSTRIAVLLEDIFGPYSFPEGDGLTFRDQLHQYLIGRDWTSFGIDLIIGSSADRLALVREQMFLPDYLSSHLSGSVNSKGQPTLGSPNILVNHSRLATSSFWITPVVLFTSLLILELLFLRYNTSSKWLRYWDYLWVSLICISSIILLFMWFGTDHRACGGNYNLIAFTPVILVFAAAKFFGLQEKYLGMISLLVIFPFLVLPFVKMSVQDIHSSVFLISLITAMKLFRVGGIKIFRNRV